MGAQLVARLGDRFRLIEAHPGGGQYDVLLLLEESAAAGSGDQVLLNRLGSMFVRRGGGAHEVIADADTWSRVIRGEVGVHETVDQLVAALCRPEVPAQGTARSRIYAVIAATLSRAALFGLGWRCLWGVEDTSGPGQPSDRAYLFEPYIEGLADVWFGEGGVQGSPQKYWFLIDEQQHPLAAFDVDGFIHLADRSSVELHGQDATSPQQVADELFTALIRLHLLELASGKPVRSGLGLPAILSAFNRKERLFLFGFAGGGLDEVELHAPGMRLDKDFRIALSRAVGLEVPEHAWSGIDYHLSWLHAALQWHLGAAWPLQQEHFPETLGLLGKGGVVTGTQEDSDLVVAWAVGVRAVVVLVEAKAYGAWSNAQLTAKLDRLKPIRQAAGPDVELRLVLTSPRPPHKLDTSEWPDWALDEAGAPRWLRLPAPRLRLATERCNAYGTKSSQGEYWRISGPST